MNVIVSFVVLLAFCCMYSMNVLQAHQPREKGGLVGAISNETPDYLLHRSRLVFETNQDGSPSSVVVVNGQDEFMQFVISASMLKPVVVLMHSMMSQDSQKMRQVYKDVAEEYKGKVIFATMDLFEQCNGTSENYELMAQFMHQENIGRLDLPIMLFFSNGMLYAPTHLPSTVLQGFYTQENLSAFVKDKFFNADASTDAPVLKAGAPDLTMTSTNLSFPVRGSKKIARKPHAIPNPSHQQQSSWWQRFFGTKKKSK